MKRAAAALAVVGVVVATSSVAFAATPPSVQSSTAPRPARPSAAPPPTQLPAPLPAPLTALVPDGVPAAQVGSLRLNDSAADIWNTWDHTSLAGTDCTTPGTVRLAAADLDLTTSGQFGDCAEITSNSTFRYGIYEARIWVQAGSAGPIANWPAFWLSGQHWPVDGEIDAFEAMGGYDSASFHYGADNSSLTKQDSALKPGWNIVDVVWKPQLLAVYYNGREFVAWDSPVITSQPMRIMFDTTTGTAGYTTGQPSTMAVDYLRVWTIA